MITKNKQAAKFCQPAQMVLPMESAYTYDDGVGKGKGDSKRQPFRHRHYQNRNADDEEVDKVFDVGSVSPWHLIRSSELFYSPADYQHDHSENGNHGTCRYTGQTYSTAQLKE